MGIVALFLGLLGSVSGAMGLLTALKAVPVLSPEFTAMFWLTLAIVLFLASIACLLIRSPYD